MRMEAARSILEIIAAYVFMAVCTIGLILFIVSGVGRWIESSGGVHGIAHELGEVSRSFKDGMDDDENGEGS